jgi:hypothetical protein
MAKILKRPMFRRGGSTNDGIMTGLTDRKQLSEGTINLDPEIARTEAKQIQDIMDSLAPIRKTRLPLGEVGLALARGVDPLDALDAGYRDFIKRDDARQALLDKRKQAAVSTALGAQLKGRDAKLSAILRRAQEAFKLGATNPDTGKPYKSVREAFDSFQIGTGDITRGTIQQQIIKDFTTFKSGTGGTKEESEFDVLKRKEGVLPIPETNFGKKDLSIKAEREEITDNENFGPGDGFFNYADGKLYVLKPGGNKEDFTSNSYIITTLNTLY